MSFNNSNVFDIIPGKLTKSLTISQLNKLLSLFDELNSQDIKDIIDAYYKGQNLIDNDIFIQDLECNNIINELLDLVEQLEDKKISESDYLDNCLSNLKLRKTASIQTVNNLICNMKNEKYAELLKYAAQVSNYGNPYIATYRGKQLTLSEFQRLLSNIELQFGYRIYMSLSDLPVIVRLYDIDTLKCISPGGDNLQYVMLSNYLTENNIRFELPKIIIDSKPEIIKKVANGDIDAAWLLGVLKRFVRIIYMTGGLTKTGKLKCIIIIDTDKLSKKEVEKVIELLQENNFHFELQDSKLVSTNNNDLRVLFACGFKGILAVDEEDFELYQDEESYRSMIDDDFNSDVDRVFIFGAQESDNTRQLIEKFQNR